MGDYVGSDIECIEAQLGEFYVLRQALAEALDQVLDAFGMPEEEMATLQKRVGGLLVEMDTQQNGIEAEAQRQGWSSLEMDVIDARSRGQEPYPEFRFTRESVGGNSHESPWRQAANEGSADAQFVLGYALVEGLGLEANEVEGAELLRHAADQGHLDALYAFYGLLRQGRGIAKDRRRASEIILEVWDEDSAHIQYAIALASLAGDFPNADSEGDFFSACSELKSAAEMGHAEAQLLLGQLNAEWQYGLINHAEAVKWMSMAASQHRFAAIEWLDQYGDLSSDEYVNLKWPEAWHLDARPRPRRGSAIFLLLSAAFMVLLVVATAKGNSLGVFLLFLFITVLAHEAGHYFAGRLVGIPSLLFGVGIGPLLHSLRSGKRLSTQYEFRLLPLMGYVQTYVVPRGVWNYWQARFAAEDAGQTPPDQPEFDVGEEPEPVVKFVSRPRQLAYFSGGLVVNFVLAIASLWIYENYSEIGRSVTAPIAGRIPAGSIAAEVGLHEGDRLLSLDGEEVVRGFYQVRDQLALTTQRAERALVIRRGEREMTLLWPVSAQMAELETEQFGLVPPVSWRIEGVQIQADDHIHPDDLVRSFEVAGRSISAQSPGAHSDLRRAFADGNGKAVTLVVQSPDGDQERTVHIAPIRRESTDGQLGYYAPPFSFLTLREPGPPTGVDQIILRVGESGIGLIRDLPSNVLRAVKKSPPEEKKGQILRAVRRNPWKMLSLFAFVNMLVLFLNLMPIPPLDGFHLIRTMAEMLIGRDLPERAVSVLMKAGWFLLAAWLILNGFLILRDLAGTFFTAYLSSWDIPWFGLIAGFVILAVLIVVRFMIQAIGRGVGVEEELEVLGQIGEDDYFFEEAGGPIDPFAARKLLDAVYRPVDKPLLAVEDSKTKTADAVDCSVFAPSEAQVGDAVFVQIFAHTPIEADAARAVAEEFDADAQRRAVKSLTTPVEYGAELLFHLIMPGLEIDDSVQELVWSGKMDSVQFGVSIPESAKIGSCVGTVKISQRLRDRAEALQEGTAVVPVGHVKFKLKVIAESVDDKKRQLAPAGEEASRYQMAFISYASSDRNQVLQRVQMLQVVGISFFQDILDLDPGIRWERELYRHIDQCDLFLLFWSSAAGQSEWVLKEIRYALARKDERDFGAPEIYPIILEGPPVPEPPADLSHLHFDDRLLYFMLERNDMHG